MSSFNLDDTVISEITYRFNSLSNKEELIDLINYVKNINPKQFLKLKDIDAKSFGFLISSKDNRYAHHKLPKKSGGTRVIDVPGPILSMVQKIFLEILVIKYGKRLSNPISHGFVRNRSIITNANIHVDKQVVLNLDLKDFFPSVHFRRIKAVLCGSTLRMTGYHEVVAFYIANLGTLNGILPQGSPLSPLLSNIVCQSLDKKLERYQKVNRVRVSRYADDITLSTNQNIDPVQTINDIKSIVTSENFKLNDKKTRVSYNNQRQQVTGIIVNKKLNIQRKYVRRIRAILHNWEEHGSEEAQLRFDRYYTKTYRGNFENVVKGYIDFLGQVKGRDDKIYIKYLGEYHYLVNSISYSEIVHVKVRKKLRSDNFIMEKHLTAKFNNNSERYISYITSAFFQIENLMNYYFYIKFTDINMLKEFMVEKLSRNKSDRKNYTHKFKSQKRVRDFSIVDLLSVYENIFHYSRAKEQYYDKIYTKIRELRNNGLHRSSIYDIDDKVIEQKYSKVKAKWNSFQKKHGRHPQKGKDEKRIEFDYELVQMVTICDYERIRVALKVMYENICIDMDQHVSLEYYDKDKL